MFENILKPLAKLNGTWSHVGLICFPEIENKGVLTQYLDLSDEELKVLLSVMCLYACND